MADFSHLNADIQGALSVLKGTKVSPAVETPWVNLGTDIQVQALAAQQGQTQGLGGSGGVGGQTSGPPQGFSQPALNIGAKANNVSE